jgi:hypothetical protein
MRQGATEAEEAVVAKIAAQRNHADAAGNQIERPPVRPVDVRLTAPGTDDVRHEESPQNQIIKGSARESYAAAA